MVSLIQLRIIFRIFSKLFSLIETAIELHSDDPKYLQTLFNSYSKKFKKKYKSAQNQKKKFETFKIQAKRLLNYKMDFFLN
jgi:hypothetical protein